MSHSSSLHYSPSPLTSFPLTPAPQSTLFSLLPPDTLVHILSYLPGHSTLPVSTVCRSLNLASKHNIIWHSIFALRPFLGIEKHFVLEDINNGYYDDFLRERHLWKQDEYTEYANYLVCAKLSYDLRHEAQVANQRVYRIEKVRRISRVFYALLAPMLVWVLCFICTLSASAMTDTPSRTTWLKWLYIVPAFLLLVAYALIACGVTMDPLLGSVLINKMRRPFRKRIGATNRKEKVVRRDVVGCVHHMVYGNLWLVALVFGFFGKAVIGGADSSYTSWFIPVHVVAALNLTVPLLGLVYRYKILRDSMHQLRFAFILYIWNLSVNFLVSMQVLLVGFKLDGGLKSVPMGGVLSPTWGCIVLWLMLCPVFCCFSPISCYISPDMSLVACYLGCLSCIACCLFMPVVLSLILLVIRYDVNASNFYLLFCFIPLWSFLATVCAITLCMVYMSRKSFWN